jgi:hypothetical protein
MEHSGHGALTFSMTLPRGPEPDRSTWQASSKASSGKRSVISVLFGRAENHGSFGQKFDDAGLGGPLRLGDHGTWIALKP